MQTKRPVTAQRPCEFHTETLLMKLSQSKGTVRFWKKRFQWLALAGANEISNALGFLLLAPASLEACSSSTSKNYPVSMERASLVGNKKKVKCVSRKKKVKKIWWAHAEKPRWRLILYSCLKSSLTPAERLNYICSPRDIKPPWRLSQRLRFWALCRVQLSRASCDFVL